MKIYFKDKENQVWAFDKNDPYESYISSFPERGYQEITKEESDILSAPKEKTPEELKHAFNSHVDARLDEFARTPYNENSLPFSSMDKARLASLTEEFKQYGDIANKLYDETWKAADSMMEKVMNGDLTIDDALSKLPALSWD